MWIIIWYNYVKKKWRKLFNYWPIYYLAPFTSFSTFLLIAAQCLWTTIFIYYDIDEQITFDTSEVFKILTATLGFILPLQLNTALQQNKACLDNYKSFIGDIQAFSWDIIAFRIKAWVHTDKNKQSSQDILSNMFDILVAMPLLAKWEFRQGGAKLDVAITKGQRLFVRTPGGGAVGTIHKHAPKLSAVDVCFYKLLDYTKDMTQTGSSILPETSIDSWERAYGAWGNIGNTRSYTQPKLFTYVMNTALVFYSILLPLQFADSGYHAIWMVAMIGYFFLGLNVAGSKVGNAFAEGPQSYQTVTHTQKEASESLEDIWKCRKLIFDDPIEKLKLFELKRDNTMLQFIDNTKKNTRKKNILGV